MFWGMCMNIADTTTASDVSDLLGYGTFWKSTGFISLDLLHLKVYLLPQKS